MDPGILIIGIMNKKVIDGDAILANLYNLKPGSVKVKTFFMLLAKNHGFSVFQNKHCIIPDFFIDDISMGFVGKNDAILHDLNDRSSIVLGRFEHCFSHQVDIVIGNPCEKCSLSTHYQFPDSERMFNGSLGDVFVTFPMGVVGEYWPLVRP